MSVYALTPLAKADIFDIWSHIAGDSEDAANRVEQAIYDAARLSPKPFARPFPPRPHNPPASFLDADPLSQLHRRLSARDGSPSGCRRSPRKKGYSAHPETAPLTRQPDRAVISITNCRRRQLVIEMPARSGCRVNGAVSGCAEYPFFRGERRQPEGEPSRADKRRC